MRWYSMLPCSLLLAGCADSAPSRPSAPPPPSQADVTYEGGDGSSVEQAVLIKGAANEGIGIKSEYVWVIKHYPGFQFETEDYLHVNNRVYGTLEGGMRGETAKRVFYFDATDYIGKP
jgi:hypothetical protein